MINLNHKLTKIEKIKDEYFLFFTKTQTANHQTRDTKVGTKGSNFVSKLLMCHIWISTLVSRAQPVFCPVLLNFCQG